MMEPPSVISGTALFMPQKIANWLISNMRRNPAAVSSCNDAGP